MHATVYFMFWFHENDRIKYCTCVMDLKEITTSSPVSPMNKDRGDWGQLDWPHHEMVINNTMYICVHIIEKLMCMH